MQNPEIVIIWTSLLMCRKCVAYVIIYFVKYAVFNEN